MAGTQKQTQPDRRLPTPRAKGGGPAAHDHGRKRDKGEGLKPKDADPDYGPPDPNDPQRSGT